MTDWQMNLGPDQEFDQLAYLTACSFARVHQPERGMVVCSRTHLGGEWWHLARQWFRTRLGLQLIPGDDPEREVITPGVLYLPRDGQDYQPEWEFFTECPELPDGVARIRLADAGGVHDMVRQLTPDTVWEFDSAFHQLCRPYFDRPALDFTAVMPVRLDSLDRLENLLEVTRYLHERLCVPQILVVENDHQPKLVAHLSDRPYIRYLFVQSDDRPWNKSRVINTALPWVTTRAMAIWDTDAVVSLGQLRMSVRGIVDEGRAAAIPFESMYHVPRKYIQQVREGRLDYNRAVEDQIFQIKRGGGQACFVVNTALFRHARGANELFWGWGGEDDEMLIRMHKLFGGITQARGPLIHIAHQRTSTSFPDERYGRLNEGERQRIYDWSPEEIRRYLGISEDSGDYLWRDEPQEVTPELQQSIDRLYASGISPGLPDYTEPRRP